MQVRMLTSWNERCGIADYSRHLAEALRDRVELDVAPATFRRSPRAVYAAMGRALSAGDAAHVQHSYAFFGGMHPLRSGWGALAGAVTRPLVVTVHELDRAATGAYRLPPAAELAYKRRFNRRTFRHPAVRRWMVHAAALKEGLLDLGVPEKHVYCRPLPIAPAPPAPAVDVRLDLALGRRRLLVIPGFLARRKGYDLALAALRRLPEEYVLVAAGGEHAADRTGTEAWLKGEARAAGVGERVAVTGFLSEERLDAVVREAELVLAPFHSMSASASLGFSLARGKAVVASDLPENRALGCVELFRSGDAEALAAAVRALAGSPHRRRELERAASEYAAAHSYEALAELTARVYEEMLRESRA